MTQSITYGAALVLFSGGQDSTVCLAWALERYERVETVGFDYGQRHAVELDATRVPCWSVFGRVFRPGLHGSATITCIDACRNSAASAKPRSRVTREIEMTAAGLPSTFVPGRNLLFFTYAAALAYRRGIRTLVGGMCETDYSGYPDCRARRSTRSSAPISLGMDEPFTIETPLMCDRQGGHLGAGA